MQTLGRYAGLDVRLCENTGDFKEVSQQWDDLCSKLPTGSMGACSGVLDFVTRFYANGEHLRILMFSGEGNLVGGFPLMQWRPRVNGLKLPYSYITNLSTAHTPVFSLPIVPGYEEQVWSSFIALLGTEAIKWTALLLKRLREPAFGNHLIATSLSSAGFPYTFSISRVGVVSVAGDFSAYARGVKGHFRRGVLRQMRRLESQGNLRLVETTDSGSVGRVFEEFCRMEDQTWKGAEGTSMERRGDRKGPQCELFRYYASIGRFNCFNLLLGNTVVSSLLCCTDGDTVYGVKVAYDPAFGRYSPGNILFWLVFKELCSRDAIKWFDFVGPADQEHCYSRYFVTGFRENARILVFNPRSIQAVCAKHVLALGRRIKHVALFSTRHPRRNGSFDQLSKDGVAQ